MKAAQPSLQAQGHTSTTAASKAAGSGAGGDFAMGTPNPSGGVTNTIHTSAARFEARRQSLPITCWISEAALTEVNESHILGR